MDADSLRYAIVSGDAKAISKAPGIGARTAERLILDLKDKVKIDADMINREIEQVSAGNTSLDNPQLKEAVEALDSLGYGQTEAMKAVKHVENAEHMDSGALLKAALKNIF
jgi:Holliday junction DNA helicase RuvA